MAGYEILKCCPVFSVKKPKSRLLCLAGIFLFYLRFACIILGKRFPGNSTLFQTVDFSFIHKIAYFSDSLSPFFLSRTQLMHIIFDYLFFLTFCFYFSVLIFIMPLIVFSSMSGFCFAANSFAFSSIAVFLSFLFLFGFDFFLNSASLQSIFVLSNQLPLMPYISALSLFCVREIASLIFFLMTGEYLGIIFICNVFLVSIHYQQLVFLFFFFC